MIEMMEVSEAFRLGDVVRLKSGSPKMVITKVEATPGFVTVGWCIYDKHTMEWAILPVEALTKSL